MGVIKRTIQRLVYAIDWVDWKLVGTTRNLIGPPPRPWKDDPPNLVRRRK